MIGLVIIIGLFASIYGDPPLKRVLKGGTATMSCTVEFDKGNNFVVWKSSRRGPVSYGTHIIPSSERTRYSVETPNDREYNLFIRRVKQSDEAIYSCEVGSRKVREWKLEIETKPEILQHSSSSRLVTLNEGEHLTLWCNVTGKPVPDVTWGRQSSGDTRAPVTNLGISGSWLAFPNISRYASDVYICSAHNSRGTATWEIEVKVTFPPDVRMFPAVEVIDNPEMDLVLTCAVQADPLYDFYWTDKDGERVNTNWRYDLTKTEDPYYRLTFISIHFRKVWHFWGTYTCHAEGSETVEKTIEVREATTATSTTSTTTTTEAGVISYDVKKK